MLLASGFSSQPVSNRQTVSQEKSANFQAALHGLYLITATCTVTDPSTPAQGHEFTCVLRNGTATIGGVAYAAGLVVRRIYHSGSWTSYPSIMLAGSANSVLVSDGTTPSWSTGPTLSGTVTCTNGTVGFASTYNSVNGGNSFSGTNASDGGYFTFAQQGSNGSGVSGWAYGTIFESVPSSGNPGNFVFSAYRNGYVWQTQARAVTAMALTSAGNLSAAGSITTANATSGIGYSSGAGGTVTQATSKSTGVTLSKVCGAITMNGAALASATSVSFTLTNTAIAATDLVVIAHDSVGTLGGYGITATPAAGSATITVRNNTAGSLSEAIVLRFAVIKAVTA